MKTHKLFESGYIWGHGSSKCGVRQLARQLLALLDRASYGLRRSQEGEAEIQASLRSLHVLLSP